MTREHEGTLGMNIHTLNIHSGTKIHETAHRKVDELKKIYN
jgi:hypothetical protein